MTGARVLARGWGWRHASRLRAAVSGVDFTIEPGERVLLLGASGAGKSTLLKGLAGVLGDAEDGDEFGELLIDGEQPSPYRGVTGLVLQDPQANTIMARVGDDVVFGCENLRVPAEDAWQRARAALDEVGLGHFSFDRSTQRLSGGERQRLALAGVLAMHSRLLLLDEPTANLDPEGVLEVRDAVLRAAESRGATVIIVEHRVDTWIDHIDRIIVLEAGGGVRADGAPGDVVCEHGASLAAEGVWVPGYPPEVARRGARADGEAICVTNDLAIGRDGVAVQQGLALSIASGCGTVITGANGAGKSTLALTLAGLLEPVAGGIDYASDLTPAGGAPVHKWRSKDLVTRIGTVFQQPEHQFVARTVRDELELGPKLLKRSLAERRATSDRLLAALRLEPLAEANPFTLSGGEQRRLSVATALATGPRVLMLDEPTFGQDRLTWIELVKLMGELIAEGRALIAVTHDAELIDTIGDERIHLGKVTA